MWSKEGGSTCGEKVKTEDGRIGAEYQQRHAGDIPSHLYGSVRAWRGEKVEKNRLR